MNWRDEGIVISANKYGEKYIILKIFTQQRGLKSALVNNSKKNLPLTQIATLVDVEWSGKSNDGLGFYKCELKKEIASHLISSSVKLMAFSSAVMLIDKCLAAEDSHPKLFTVLLNLIANSNQEEKLFLSNYAMFEKELLKEIGFGLDLEKCVVSGVREDLFYLSPNSGGAVCRKEGEAYKDKLFLLNNLLCCNNVSDLKNIDFRDIYETLKITRYFLFKNINRHISIFKWPEIYNLFLDKLGKLNVQQSN
jgi:DNA repair protein RecO (recombination protein O)